MERSDTRQLQHVGRISEAQSAILREMHRRITPSANPPCAPNRRLCDAPQIAIYADEEFFARNRRIEPTSFKQVQPESSARGLS